MGRRPGRAAAKQAAAALSMSLLTPRQEHALTDFRFRKYSANQ
jgi:hypothetical protein